MISFNRYYTPYTLVYTKLGEISSYSLYFSIIPELLTIYSVVLLKGSKILRVSSMKFLNVTQKNNIFTIFFSTVKSTRDIYLAFFYLMKCIQIHINRNTEFYFFKLIEIQS